LEKVKVKILGLSFSHRKSRNTAWLVQYALKAAEKFGRRISEVADIETEFIDLAGKDIRQCIACERRWDTPNFGLPYKGTVRPEGRCIIKNDYMAKELRQKLIDADAYIHGCPVYGMSTTSLYRMVMERSSDILCNGDFTNKPAASVTVAEFNQLGQETTLLEMNHIITGAEMLCVSWPTGVAGTSGPPYGPLPADDDAKVIGVKKDRYARYCALVCGRRVAEIAVMMKLAKRQLGDIFYREFYQVLHPPHGEETWVWKKLDPEDEALLDDIEGPGKVR
jgi:multimeric flavodoxin WrbA